MNERRANHNRKEKSISMPSNFQHLHHVTYDSAESIFHGVPSQWRENVLKSSLDKSCSELDHTMNLESHLSSVKPPYSKRFRISTSTNNIPITENFWKDLNLIQQNPLPKIKNVNLMYEFELYVTLYGSIGDSSEVHAFKFYKIDKSDHAENIKSEIEFHRQCSHPNILEMASAYMWSNSILMVFKNKYEITLCDMVDHIFNVRRTYVMQRYTNGIVAYILHSVVVALQHIHLNRYIHRDLKSDNILISPEGIVKLSDFGACAKVTNNYINSEIIGTPYWMAPEIAKKERYSYEVDIWSLGSVLLELLDGKPLFYQYSPEEALEKLKNLQNKEDLNLKPYPQFSKLVNPFLEICFAIKRNERASSTNIHIHPFFNSRSNPDTLKEFILLFTSF